MQQRLEQMLRLAFGFALLGAQALEFVDDVGEFLLEGKRGKRYFQGLECPRVYEGVCSTTTTQTSNPASEICEKRSEVLWKNC